MKPFFRGIGLRIFISFTTLLVVLIAILAVATWTYLSRTAYNHAANELRVQSITLVQQLQNTLTRLENSVRVFGSDGGRIDELLVTHNANSPHLEAYLRKRLDQQKLFEEFYVFDLNGHVIAKTDKEWPTTSMTNQTFFVNGLKRVSFSDILEDPNYYELMLLVSGPIGDPRNPVGVLVGKVRLPLLYDLMDQKSGITGNVEAFLVDNQLRFVTPAKTAPSDSVLQSHLASTPLKQHLEEEFWVGRYKNYKGEEVLGTVRKTQVYEGFLVIEKQFTDVEDHLNFLKRTLAMTVIFLLAALTFTTVAIARSITQPVLKLVEGAQAIADGRTDTPIPIPQTNDEIAFLSREFDRMRVRLNEYQSRLKQRLEVSERKRIESERMAAIGTLAASLAHEIRNPLNGMSLLVSQLERSTKDMADSERKVLTGLRSEIGRLDRLVNDILDYARPFHIQKERVSIFEIIREITEIYRPILEKHRIHLVGLDPGDLIRPAWQIPFFGDRDKLKMALTNVIQNAIEAIAGRANVQTPGEIHFSFETVASEFVLTIHDNGPGISAEVQDRLFELFVSTKEKGTGFGLSSVRKIILAHGGHVEVEVPKTGGTSLLLFFPIEENQDTVASV